VNFGHKPWWYGGQFCQKAGKKFWKKRLFAKEMILKKMKWLFLKQSLEKGGS
jgi:hypothetical protein